MSKRQQIDVFDPSQADYSVGREGNPNWKNRSVFIGDCLDVMRQMNTGSVDLIYLDPPFNKKKQFQAPIGSAAEGIGFKDFWVWDDVKSYEADELKKIRPEIVEFIKVVNSFRSESEGAYLLMMATRLLECYRLLKSTGSLYLHCDHSMNGYLRIVLDMIFGANDFRNELVWYYKNASRGKKKFANSHDTIFYYSKSENAIFYRDNVLMPFASGMTEWRYTKGGQAGKPIPKGKTPDDVIDMPSLNTMSKERVGYPTQKPLALLERIIQASSKEGDMVLDPFCGCATTLIAAEKLGRQYAGIDIGSNATGLLGKRLDDETRQGNIVSGVPLSPMVYKKPPVRTDLGGVLKSAAQKNAYKEFLWGKQFGNCAGCGVHFVEPRNLELDRIVPGADGGTYHPGNLQALCGSCNSMKGARTQKFLFKQLDRYEFRSNKK